jgi:D-glycero-alpha-D-manno-heptose 1-phosphate guanylyltransferase
VAGDEVTCDESQIQINMTGIPAIVLAGGLGTRLRSVISDLPKPMAPVCGKPFLHYIFQYLRKQGISDVVLSVGYKSEVIKDFFGEKYAGINIRYAVEQEPLGTGGGIAQAMAMIDSDAFVLNGDTFFDVDLTELYDFYKKANAEIALALRRMYRFDRYGTVEAGNRDRVLQFHEKQYRNEGLINGGVYVLNKNLFRKVEEIEEAPLPQKFSFEKDILEKHLNHLHFHGKEFKGYFIDIGIPEDYSKAQEDFK